MIQKIILVMLCSFTSLWSTDIVGTWQMDMQKSQKANPLDKMEASKQLMVMMFVGTWNEVKFASDGTFRLTQSKQNGVWQKSGDRYIVQASAKASKNSLMMLNDHQIKIVFNDVHMGILTFYFVRYGKEKTEHSKSIHFDAVYRTKKQKGLYHFLLLTKNGRYHYVQTNKTDHLSAHEITSNALESLLAKKNKYGEVFIDKGSYTSQDNSFFTVFSHDKIALISSTTLKYLGKKFVMQK